MLQNIRMQPHPMVRDTSRLRVKLMATLIELLPTPMTRAFPPISKSMMKSMKMTDMKIYPPTRLLAFHLQFQSTITLPLHQTQCKIVLAAAVVLVDSQVRLLLQLLLLGEEVQAERADCQYSPNFRLGAVPLVSS